jgi:hypothetical protein
LPPKEKVEIVASLCEAKTAKEPDKNIGSNHILRNRQLIFRPKFLTIWSPSPAKRPRSGRGELNNSSLALQIDTRQTFTYLTKFNS